MRLIVGLIFFLLLASRVSSQSQLYPLSSLEGEDYNFRITESADYTNHIDESMLITVEGNEQQSFSISDSGSNSSQGIWISGLEQVSVENSVSIGALVDSGFNATADPSKFASVFTFNKTLFLASNYTDIVRVTSLPFTQQKGYNLTLVDNSTVFTPLISFPIEYFLVSVSDYIQVYENYMRSYIKELDHSFNLNLDVSSTSKSLTYSVSGKMIDIHQFSHHTGGIDGILDYNIIDVDGKVSVSYNDHVLSEYQESYDITYNDVRIMRYSYSINVRPGSGGNFRIGGTQLASITWPYYIVGIVILIFTVRYLTKRYG